MVVLMAIGISTLLEPALLALDSSGSLSKGVSPRFPLRAGGWEKGTYPYICPAMTSPICVVPTSWPPSPAISGVR